MCVLCPPLWPSVFFFSCVPKTALIWSVGLRESPKKFFKLQWSRNWWRGEPQQQYLTFTSPQSTQAICTTCGRCQLSTVRPLSLLECHSPAPSHICLQPPSCKPHNTCLTTSSNPITHHTLPCANINCHYKLCIKVPSLFVVSVSEIYKKLSREIYWKPSYS